MFKSMKLKRLRKRLFAGDAQQRAVAARELAQLAPDIALARLTELLPCEDNKECCRLYCELIEDLSPENAQGHFLASLTAPNPVTRASVIQALGRRGVALSTELLIKAAWDPRAVRPAPGPGQAPASADAATYIVAALGDEDHAVSTAAWKSLQGIISQEHVTDLLAELTSAETACLRRRQVAAALDFVASWKPATPAEETFLDLAKGRYDQVAKRGATAAEFLSALLGHPNWRVRVKASEALGSIEDHGNAASLARLLADETWQVRRAAAAALSQTKHPDAVPALLTAISDLDVDVAVEAAKALGANGGEASVPPLVDLLGHANPLVQQAAAKALGSTGHPPSVPALLERLSSEKNKLVVQGIVTALGQLDHPGVIPALLRLLGSDDPACVQAAAEALGKRKAKEALRPLQELATHPESDVRICVAKALHELGSDKGVQLLLDEVRTGRDSLERDVAGSTLGEIAQDSVVDEMLSLLADPEDEDGRSAAAAALANLRSTRAVEPLFNALGDRSYSVRWRVSEALGALGGEEILARLTQIVTHSTGDSVSAAVKALGAINDPGAIEPLIQVLREDRGGAASDAARALAKYPTDQVLSALMAIAVDSSAGDLTRAYSIAALGELNDLRAAAVMERSLSDEDAWVREYSAESLGKLVGWDDDARLIPLLRDGAKSVRGNAARVLGALAASSSLSRIMTLLDDREVDVRYAAATALGDLKAIEAVGPLVEKLKDPSLRVRSAAAGALRRLAWQPRSVEEKARLAVASYSWDEVAALGAEAVEATLLALQGDAHWLRRDAAKCLAKMDWQPPSDELRAWVAVANENWEKLATLGESALVPLKEVTGEYNRGRRLAAIAVLGRIDSDEAVALLQSLAKHWDSATAAAAEEAMGGRSSAAPDPSIEKEPPVSGLGFKVPPGKYTHKLASRDHDDFASAITAMGGEIARGERSGLDELEELIRLNSGEPTVTFYEPGGLRALSGLDPDRTIADLVQRAREGTLFRRPHEVQSQLTPLALVGCLPLALEAIGNQAGAVRAREFEMLHAQMTLSTKYRIR